jgi:two-component system, chemotaxis family, protein-glutamate methylesterase/glutaminase
MSENALGIQQMTDNRTGTSLPVVCIGMSSGGIQPLLEVFRKLSPKTGMAFVIIHHVRTTTLLPEILSDCTVMPVELASPGQQLFPNHVYVLAPGKEMLAADGFFSVLPRTKTSGWPDVLTVFLNSLCQSGHPGIAVVLSGLDRDGAAALKAFKQNGGITIVQEPESAESPQMPMAAIGTGCVDYVLAPSAIAGKLSKLGELFAGQSLAPGKPRHLPSPTS